MAEKKIYMGSMGPFLLDDSDDLDDSDGDWSGETQVGFRTDSQMVATEFVGIPISSISVTDIDDPSAELNSLSASTIGGLIAVYESVDSADDEFTMYLWDTDAAAENVPYTVDGDGGTWVAVGGKYFNGHLYVEGNLEYGGDLGAHTIASHSDTSVTGAELTTVEGRVDQDLKVAASPSFTGLTKIGSGSDYASFAADGELTLHGTARVKKEFSISAINLDKGNQGPDAVVLGNSIGYSYDIGDDSVMNFEVPYDCDTSEDIKLEIYWYINEARTGSNEEVQWRCQWSACPVDATEAIDAPTHSGTIDFGNQLIPETAKYLTEVSGVIAGASISDGDFVSLTVDRVALDGVGTDPIADPVIVQIEFEYTVNKLGEAT